MAIRNCKRPLIMLVLASLCISLGSGCSELRYHRIYVAALAGAAVGGIIGYQSDECGEGVAVGAGVFAAGELLRQIDDLKEEQVEEAAEEVAKGDDVFAPTYLER